MLFRFFFVIFLMITISGLYFLLFFIFLEYLFLVGLLSRVFSIIIMKYKYFTFFSLYYNYLLFSIKSSFFILNTASALLSIITFYNHFSCHQRMARFIHFIQLKKFSSVYSLDLFIISLFISIILVLF